MKISNVSSTQTVSQGQDGQASRMDSVRALKMATNATPGMISPVDTQELVNNDDNTDTVDTKDELNAAPEATEPLSPQFAALAKQRRALQQERRAFEDSKKEHAATSQGSDAIPVSRLKSEPLKVLLESGVTYDQLTEAILADQGSSETNALKSRIDELEKGIDKKLTDRDAQAEQQVLAEMRKEAEKIIVDNDDFELVRETNSVPDVMRLIERTYRETGEVLDVSEALNLVEDELFKRNQKLVTLKKMQGLINKPAEQVPQQRTSGMRTLTNRDTASIPLSPKQRALMAFRGELKK